MADIHACPSAGSRPAGSSHEMEALKLEIAVKEQELQLAARWSLEQVQRMTHQEHVSGAEIKALELRLRENCKRNHAQATELGELSAKVTELSEALELAYEQLGGLQAQEEGTATVSRFQEYPDCVDAASRTPATRTKLLLKSQEISLISAITKENFHLSAAVSRLEKENGCLTDANAALRKELPQQQELAATVKAQKKAILQQNATVKRLRKQITDLQSASDVANMSRAESDLLAIENATLIQTYDALETSFSELYTEKHESDAKVELLERQCAELRAQLAAKTA